MEEKEAYPEKEVNKMKARNLSDIEFEIMAVRNLMRTMRNLMGTGRNIVGTISV